MHVLDIAYIVAIIQIPTQWNVCEHLPKEVIAVHSFWVTPIVELHLVDLSVILTTEKRRLREMQATSETSSWTTEELIHDRDSAGNRLTIRSSEFHIYIMKVSSTPPFH
jgi:hypothetical protein